MASLVGIPWQPGYKVTPAFLVRLQRACQLAGHNIIVDDAWRPYAEQKYYWDRYVNKAPGWTIASNPDDPNAQNNHLRGSAVDIKNIGDRAAMLAAGFTADPNEWWHFNDPNWRNTPIIMTDTSTSGGGSTPIGENDLDANQANQLEQIYNAIFKGGDSMPDKGNSIGTSLSGIVQVVDRINAVVSQPVNRVVNGKTVAISQIQDNADTRTIVGRMEPKLDALAVAAAPVIDYAALAAAIVKAGGTAPSVAEIAKAVNDDAAKRLAG